MQQQQPVDRPLPPGRLPRALWPDITDLVTEDDTPVESWYQERQMALLGDVLTLSWQGPGDGRPFLCGTDIGLFDSPKQVGVAPDVMLGLDVEMPQEPMTDKHSRSWFVWRYGPPLLVAEIVSRRGGDEEDKLVDYARIGVRYVIIWDPNRYLSKRRLRIYRLDGGRYHLIADRWFPELGLGVKSWSGTFQGKRGLWLRWHDATGLLPNPEEIKLEAEEIKLQAEEALRRAHQAEEKLDRAEQRADQATHLAGQEKERADQAEQRAARLEARLGDLGMSEP